jgi:hypothetical protein
LAGAVLAVAPQQLVIPPAVREVLAPERRFFIPPTRLGTAEKLWGESIDLVADGGYLMLDRQLNRQRWTLDVERVANELEPLGEVGSTVSGDGWMGWLSNRTIIYSEPMTGYSTGPDGAMRPMVIPARTIVQDHYVGEGSPPDMRSFPPIGAGLIRWHANVEYSRPRSALPRSTGPRG